MLGLGASSGSLWLARGAPLPVLYAGPSSRQVVAPTVEPLTVDEGKLWSGFDWPAGDPREPLMATTIAASRAYVEDDTGLALLTQTRETYLEGAHISLLAQMWGWQGVGGALVWMPPRCRPVQSVVSMTYRDSTGAEQPIDPSWYGVDPGTGAIRILPMAWPVAPITIQVVAGWPDVATLRADEPRLVHLVGRLVAHNMTIARDLVVEMRGSVVQVPLGYEAEVQPYRPEVLA